MLSIRYRKLVLVVLVLLVLLLYCGPSIFRLVLHTRPSSLGEGALSSVRQCKGLVYVCKIITILKVYRRLIIIFFYSVTASVCKNIAAFPLLQTQPAEVWQYGQTDFGSQHRSLMSIYCTHHPNQRRGLSYPMLAMDSWGLLVTWRALCTLEMAALSPSLSTTVP